jgi:hypothetical protein
VYVPPRNRVPNDHPGRYHLLQVSPPLEEIDKRLFDWISSRATVLVVLGWHIRMNKSEAQKILTALRILLDKRPDVQVLWKLMKVGDFQLDGADVDGDRLRVTSWLEADPMSLLRTGKLICVVNHGGSNSYHEALAYVFCLTRARSPTIGSSFPRLLVGSS